MPKKTVAAKTEPVVAPAPVAAPAVEVKVESVAAEEKSVYGNTLQLLNAMRQQLSTVITEVKAREKQVERDLKAAQKSSKRKNKGGARAPSGFVKPALVSDQLAEFLSRPKGSMVARTEVTREINTYIREHNLQDPKNRRHILPDAKLKKLLALKPTDELTYFNLQRFISHHFQKQAPAVPTA
jgi:chromatin remodeling complex protein RSC6